jgi:asparagine synthase (glutamine-hydrolysing)
MFAFAVWDRARRRLFMARDRLGVKPLYWTLAGSTLAFGSEIKAILLSGLIEPQANAACFPELLGTRYISGEDTLFRHVRKLLPGHLLVFENGQVRIRQYWDVPVNGPAEQTTNVVERFRELLEESIRLRLMSDVPLGVFLSGGVDSSAIAALMARMVDRPIETFSVAFKDRACNELAYARTVAGAIGARSHEIVIDDRDFFGALPRLLWHEDEPVAHPSSVPLYFVSALAGRTVKVVLTGEGSDELLAGYGKYVRSLWNWRLGAVYERTVPQRLRRQLARLARHLPRRLRRYAGRSFLTMERSAESMFFDNFAAVGANAQHDLLSEAFCRTPNTAYASSLDWYHRPHGSATELTRLLYADLKTYLVELLMKQDQMSMAASIESRVPFLDHKLVEYSALLPDRWKLSGMTTKRVLREAVADVLPPSILARRKMGFPVPFDAWVRGRWEPLIRDVLLDRRTRERGIVNPRAVERLLDDHRQSRTNGGERIWALLNLELWHRTFIDKQGIQTLPLAGTVITASHAHPVAQIGPAVAAR